VKKNLILLLCLFCVYPLMAQQLSLPELRQLVLQNNGQLIAQKLEIDATEAEIVQAKLLPNPTLSISEVNFWTNGTAEELRYLFGKYGKHQQIGVELEQLIETAGKRKKRIALASLQKESAVLEYEELMRELSLELSEAYWEWAAAQEKEELLRPSVELYQRLNEQYSRQARLQNVPQSDYLRIQNQLLIYRQELAQQRAEKNEALGKIRILTQAPQLSDNQLNKPVQNYRLSEALPLNLSDLALQQNIGLRQQSRQVNVATQELALEKANRTPDLQLQLNYDRGGNIMRDFVGVGVSIDLPVFDRNQGNILAASHRLQKAEQSRTVLQQQLINKVEILLHQLQDYEPSLRDADSLNSDEQRRMLENYEKHLHTRGITLLEFIDYVEAYREAKTGVVDLALEYHKLYEQLLYLTGQNL